MEVGDSVHDLVVQIFPAETTGNLPGVGEQNLNAWKCWWECEVCEQAEGQLIYISGVPGDVKPRPSFHADHEQLGTAGANPWNNWRSPVRLVPNLPFFLTFGSFWKLCTLLPTALVNSVTSQFLLSLNPTVFINSLAQMCLWPQCSHFFLPGRICCHPPLSSKTQG